jgi:hypothetical protein
VEEKNINVIELRNYQLKPNVRDKFATYFSKNFVDSQNIIGGNVLGQFCVADKPDNFFWVRGFENMKVRSRFLPEFYYGDVWKKFGGDANEMMIDSDNVYLLKPLNERQIFRKRPFIRIDFCFAADGKISELVSYFESEFVPKSANSNFTNVSFWLNELAENDFPKLPAFQYENLLVVISGFENEAEYQSKPLEFGGKVNQNIVKKENLLIYEI